MKALILLPLLLLTACERGQSKMVYNINIASDPDIFVCEKRYCVSYYRHDEAWDTYLKRHVPTEKVVEELAGKL